VSGSLLDTNVISELVRPAPEPKVTAWMASTKEELLYLSVLTLGEIRKGAEKMKDTSRRTAIEAWLSGHLAVRFAGRILAIDAQVADRWGRLAAGAPPGAPLRVIDGLLAATAIHHNLTLVTRNVRDVTASGAALFNPWIS
jgi:predicted nucleic acid-binding protein